MLSLEQQIAELEKRTARARANPEQCQAAMNLVFEGLTPEDDVKIDTQKVKALELQLAEDHQHNMEIMRQRGIVGTIEIITPENYVEHETSRLKALEALRKFAMAGEGDPIEGDELPNP